MRPSLLFALSIFLAYSPLTQAESPQVGEGGFLAALEKVKLAEKAEREGDLNLASSRLEEAVRTLDEVPANQRHLIPGIIKLSEELFASSLTRVEVALVQRRMMAQLRSHRLPEKEEEVQFSIIVAGTLPKTGFVLVSDQP